MTYIEEFMSVLVADLEIELLEEDPQFGKGQTAAAVFVGLLELLDEPFVLVELQQFLLVPGDQIC